MGEGKENSVLHTGEDLIKEGCFHDSFNSNFFWSHLSDFPHRISSSFLSSSILFFCFLGLFQFTWVLNPFGHAMSPLKFLQLCGQQLGLLRNKHRLFQVALQANTNAAFSRKSLPVPARLPCFFYMDHGRLATGASATTGISPFWLIGHTELE